MIFPFVHSEITSKPQPFVFLQAIHKRTQRLQIVTAHRTTPRKVRKNRDRLETLITLPTFRMFAYVKCLCKGLLQFSGLKCCILFGQSRKLQRGCQEAIKTLCMSKTVFVKFPNTRCYHFYSGTYLGVTIYHHNIARKSNDSILVLHPILGLS